MKLADITRNARNPRKITDAAFAKLCESIKRDPQFMALRPIVVDGDGVVIGGNQRLRACLHLGMTEVPDAWVMRAADLTADQRKRFVLLDNGPEGASGEWDMDMLAADWTVPELDMVGIGMKIAPAVEDGTGTDKAGASPWDRVGEASDGVVLTFGELTARLPQQIYDAVLMAASENPQEWLTEVMRNASVAR